MIGGYQIGLFVPAVRAIPLQEAADLFGRLAALQVQCTAVKG
jgi:hypothetical protein